MHLEGSPLPWLQNTKDWSESLCPVNISDTVTEKCELWTEKMMLWMVAFSNRILANLWAVFFYSTGEREGYRWKEKGRKCTFLIDPLHCEELVIVHGAHVPHLPVQALVGDGWLEVSDHDVPAEKKRSTLLDPTDQRNQSILKNDFFCEKLLQLYIL